MPIPAVPFPFPDLAPALEPLPPPLPLKGVLPELALPLLLLDPVDVLFLVTPLVGFDLA